MPIYQLKLLERKEIARATQLFVFEKAEGFHFIPGQYAGVTLINPSEQDAGGITRRFSLLSTPQDAHIAIATRIQPSAYKRVLSTLPVGSEIKLAGPSGKFVLHTETTVPAVLIAGGIGVAPFYSMIKHAVETHSTQPIYLFYGNNQVEETALLQELNDFAKQHPHFHFIPTVNQPDAHWQGETGLITVSMLKKYLPELMLPYYYICGSAKMVTHFQQTLLNLDIAANQIFVEDFPGYS